VDYGQFKLSGGGRARGKGSSSPRAFDVGGMAAPHGWACAGSVDGGGRGTLRSEDRLSSISVYRAAQAPRVDARPCSSQNEIE